MAAIDHFNALGEWVVESILMPSDHSDRVLLLGKMVDVMHKVFSMNNFNSSSAILAGLLQRAISIQKKLWQDLPTVTKRRFDEVKITLEPFGNFKVYRQK